jgi:hypothetical protein
MMAHTAMRAGSRREATNPTKARERQQDDAGFADQLDRQLQQAGEDVGKREHRDTHRAAAEGIDDQDATQERRSTDRSHGVILVTSEVAAAMIGAVAARSRLPGR